MRIATWNLEHGAKRKRPIPPQIAKIKEINPDVLVLTETCNEVDLSPFGYTGVSCKKNNDGNYYAAIWTRFPIIGVHQTSDPTLTVCAQVACPLGNLLVYGTIITYHLDKGPNEDSRAWAEHYKAIGVQGDDWARLSAETGLPMIIAGDFNQTRDGSKRTYGTKHGRDLLTAQLSRSSLSCLTTEDFGSSGKINIDPAKGWARNNIDHICTTKDAFEILSVGAWDHFSDGIYLSDHNGVYLDIVSM